MLTVKIPPLEKLNIGNKTPLKKKDSNNIEEHNEYVQISKSDYEEMLRVYELYVSKAKTRSDRWYTDEEYRRKRLDSMNSYSKKRYQEDPEYREKRKNQAKDRWRRKKISSELSNGCNTPSSDTSSMNNSLELSPSNALENSGTPTQFE